MVCFYGVTLIKPRLQRFQDYLQVGLGAITITYHATNNTNAVSLASMALNPVTLAPTMALIPCLWPVAFVVKSPGVVLGIVSITALNCC